MGGLIERLNRLSALHAEDLADDGRRQGVARSLCQGAGTFLQGYLGRGGWREGRLGLLTAMLSAFFPVLSHVRASDVAEARSAALAQAAEPAHLRQVVGLGAR